MDIGNKQAFLIVIVKYFLEYKIIPIKFYLTLHISNLVYKFNMLE